MTDMVERVARAIEPLIILEFGGQRSARFASPQSVARAAIAAMREPTEGILGVLAWNGASRGTWQDCIDESLEEDKP